jgi:hypothetical protein
VKLTDKDKSSKITLDKNEKKLILNSSKYSFGKITDSGSNK